MNLIDDSSAAERAFNGADEVAADAAGKALYSAVSNALGA